MKVIVGDNYYVQVRDIFFIGNLYNSKMIIAYYMSFINRGYGDNDFVKINNKSIKQILDTDLIIDFTDYKDTSIVYLSNVLANLFMTTQNTGEVTKHKENDIRDIISFKKGELNYSIPLIPTDEVSYINQEMGLAFRSTIFDNYFVFQSNSDLDNVQYLDYLRFCINEVIEEKFANQVVSYDIINNESYLVIRFNVEQKKSKSIKDIFRRKLKKEVK